MSFFFFLSLYWAKRKSTQRKQYIRIGFDDKGKKINLQMGEKNEKKEEKNHRDRITRALKDVL